MRHLVTALVALALVLAPFAVVVGADAPRFPFKTYAEIPVQAAQPGVCDGGVTYFLINEEWSSFGSATKDIFIHKTPDGGVDYVYFAVGTADDGKVTVTRVLPLEEAKRLYPDPCTYFREQGA
jgi:hypothetical protein